MHAGLNEFLDEQAKGLAELVENARKARVAAARRAALESAGRIKALNGRVRGLARSGVRLTSISQGAAQRLIELQEEIVTAALTDAAARLQRIADTESLRDLARGQTEVLQSARQRIVEDMSRALTILRRAARDARGVVAPAAPTKTVRRKPSTRRAARSKVATPASRAKRKVRKTKTVRRRR